MAGVSGLFGHTGARGVELDTQMLRARHLFSQAVWLLGLMGFRVDRV